MAFRLVLRFTLVFFCLSVAIARSQDTTATILGTLTDASGSVLPGVTISVKHVDTSQTRTVTSDEAGRYRVQLLQPGVVMSRSSVQGSNVGQGVKISVAGSRPSQNLFTLDGTAYNDALNNTPASANGVMTGVETIKEFRVVTNAMSAEYGRAGGGVFNVVTKSGTNQFTGSIFEFFRDDSLDAKN
jgi:outer membrane receptor for ferrienterochelin and colicin